jgi:peptidoglycan-N-acetylglucosamine deacetylase
MSTTPWPDGCMGAVSLTFDDGISSQLDRAIPVMREFGLRGTFYIPPRGDNWREVLQPWRAVYDAGHEIGNHSLSHTCARGFSDDPNAHGLERMTLEGIEADVLEAERRLQELFPMERRSFCYPCYQSHVGEGLTRQSYVPIIAKHFVAGRAFGEVPNPPATCDLHHVWSWPVRGNHGAELVGLAEQAATMGRWGILTFHGISQGHLPVADPDFRELCKHLGRARHIWVAPAAEVAEAIWAWRAKATTCGR